MITILKKNDKAIWMSKKKTVNFQISLLEKGWSFRRVIFKYFSVLPFILQTVTSWSLLNWHVKLFFISLDSCKWCKLQYPIEWTDNNKALGLLFLKVVSGLIITKCFGTDHHLLKENTHSSRSAPGNWVFLLSLFEFVF